MNSRATAGGRGAPPQTETRMRPPSFSMTLEATSLSSTGQASSAGDQEARPCRYSKRRQPTSTVL